MLDCIAEFQNVSIDYELKRQSLHAVREVSLGLRHGRITALVGESGSGKTTLASALLNCVSSPGRVVSGRVLVGGEEGEEPVDVVSLDERALNAFRWSRVSMVFQGAQSALNPIATVFDQFYETLQVHGKALPRKAARAVFAELLSRVNLNEKVLDAYPHEISGGMKQRVMIVFSMLLEPGLIILDEPTTALDVITQNYIFTLLKRINLESGTTMLLLTHDIAVVAEYADDIGIMYGGRLMEYGSVKDVFRDKLHPYTRGLIYATPSLLGSNDRVAAIPGSPPDIADPPAGCPFAPRCPECRKECGEGIPPAREIAPGHTVSCFLYGEGEENARA